MTFFFFRILPINTRTQLFILGFFAAILLMAQPSYAPDIQKEKLGRGLVLLRDDDSLVVSWRLLEGDKKVPFSVYKDGKRLNEQNIWNVTFFKTLAPKEETEITKALLEDYFRALRCEAIEAWANAYLPL